MEDSRDERRRKAKAEEQKRREELDKLMDEPPHAPFEAPATGIIVNPTPKRPKR